MLSLPKTINMWMCYIRCNIFAFPFLRSCVAGRSLAGSTAWPTSVPACHSSRAACPKSGWPQRPYSPASARSSTEQGSWRRPRTPLPRPPWHPCRRARLHPPPALPPCLVIHATSPAGRSWDWETWGWTKTVRWQKYLRQVMSQATAKSPVRLYSKLLPACGKNVSQISTMVQSGGFLIAREEEYLLQTKAGFSLSEHGCWIPKIHPNHPNLWCLSSFFSQLRMQDGRKARCLRI